MVIEAIAAVAKVAGEVAVETVKVAGEAAVEVTKKVAETTANTVIEGGKQICEHASALSENCVKEVGCNNIERIKSVGDGVLTKIDDIKNLTMDQLKQKVELNLESKNSLEHKVDTYENLNEGLNDKEKGRIREETGWSDRIIDSINSMDEYEIYKNAKLEEYKVGEKDCLIRSDIDWEKKDAFGRTNRERIAEGHAPLDEKGKPIQLHHIGQRIDSPLSELTFEEHRCGGNDKILHDKTKETEIHGEGSTWSSERSEYWKARAEDEGSNNR